MMTPDESLLILEAQEREMAVDGRHAPSARQAEALQRAQPPLLDQACVARARDSDRQVASPLHHPRPGDIADEPGSPVDGAGAARDDDGAAAAATRSAAAGSRQSSPHARPISSATGQPEELSATPSTPPRPRIPSTTSTAAAMYRSATFGPLRAGDTAIASLRSASDEFLVERKLWWARQMPLAERRARRYSKPQSYVG
jgi:hypothetical protein